MGKHRAEKPPRVRPRIGRMLAASLALSVTGIALLSGIGVINLDAGPASASGAPSSAPTGVGRGAGVGAVSERVAPRAQPAPTASADQPETPTPTRTPTRETDQSARAAGATLPASSGAGRRVVFSISDQRVWLVGKDGTALRTYLVSGSVTDNLKPGSYDVYSRSRWAVGIDDSGVMEYFVRFTRGDNAAIGFHSIPKKNGKPLQTESQLGTPQSHGCIRQKLADAERMWDFADVGTEVVVVA